MDDSASTMMSVPCTPSSNCTMAENEEGKQPTTHAEEGGCDDEEDCLLMGENILTPDLDGGNSSDNDDERDYVLSDLTTPPSAGTSPLDFTSKCCIRGGLSPPPLQSSGSNRRDQPVLPTRGVTRSSSQPQAGRTDHLHLPPLPDNPHRHIYSYELEHDSFHRPNNYPQQPALPLMPSAPRSHQPFHSASMTPPRGLSASTIMMPSPRTLQVLRPRTVSWELSDGEEVDEDDASSFSSTGSRRSFGSMIDISSMISHHRSTSRTLPSPQRYGSSPMAMSSSSSPSSFASGRYPGNFNAWAPIPRRPIPFPLTGQPRTPTRRTPPPPTILQPILSSHDDYSNDRSSSQYFVPIATPPTSEPTFS